MDPNTLLKARYLLDRLTAMNEQIVSPWLFAANGRAIPIPEAEVAILQADVDRSYATFKALIGPEAIAEPEPEPIAEPEPEPIGEP
jgi:hypothetical protein